MMLKILFALGVFVVADALTCLTGKQTDKTLTSKTCTNYNKCFFPKFTPGSAPGSKFNAVGYGCGACSDRADTSKFATSTYPDVAEGDCDECSGNDCNKKLVITEKKCFAYTWNSGTSKYDKSSTATKCANTLDKDFKCHMPADMSTVDSNLAEAKKGCGDCPSSANCVTQADTPANKYCATDSCNVPNTKSCYTYNWVEKDSAYVLQKETPKVCPGFAADFKCNMPKNMKAKDKYVTGSGCGACPTGKECADTCDKQNCNSAATLFTVVPVIMTALFALLY